mgnify:CR=1 FL=1
MKGQDYLRAAELYESVATVVLLAALVGLFVVGLRARVSHSLLPELLPPRRQDLAVDADVLAHRLVVLLGDLRKRVVELSSGELVRDQSRGVYGYVR